VSRGQDTLRARLADPAPLSREDADALVDGLADVGVDEGLRRSWLLGLSARAVRADELAALAEAMRARAVPVSAPVEAVDSAGTGGDASHSVNLSTAAALVVASCGVPVVKHGNRAISGRCGSADVLEALGVPLAASAMQAEDQLARAGFTFLFAPTFHAATRAIGPLRRALGVPTAFNLLGPLTNPARPRVQLVGAASPGASGAIAGALGALGVRGAVVHGDNGWDEATPCSPWTRWGSDGSVGVEDAAGWGVSPCAAVALAGGEPSMNAGILLRAFDGARDGPAAGVFDAVRLQAALLLNLAGYPRDEAVTRATEALTSGSVRRVLSLLAAS
jgi:anthranilate phosphoribosyltransferase